MHLLRNVLLCAETRPRWVPYSRVFGFNLISSNSGLFVLGACIACSPDRLFVKMKTITKGCPSNQSREEKLWPELWPERQSCHPQACRLNDGTLHFLLWRRKLPPSCAYFIAVPISDNGETCGRDVAVPLSMYLKMRCLLRWMDLSVMKFVLNDRVRKKIVCNIFLFKMKYWYFNIFLWLLLNIVLWRLCNRVRFVTGRFFVLVLIWLRPNLPPPPPESAQ